MAPGRWQWVVLHLYIVVIERNRDSILLLDLIIYLCKMNINIYLVVGTCHLLLLLLS